VLVVSLFIGSRIMRFFGISVPALRIAGGLVVAVLVAATVTVACANASIFSRCVGRAGTRVIYRLSAFPLLCIGVQIILTGVSDALPARTAHGIQMVDSHGGEIR
jgi:small neutral amino acid transporter SnatA (MarC family)